MLASRSIQAADLTRSGLYTLSPQSVLVAKRLGSDLAVTGFFRPNEQTGHEASESAARESDEHNGTAPAAPEPTAPAPATGTTGT